MRGKVAYTDLQRPSPGITPAYAGKSLLKLLHHVGLRDHPRVCGEKGAPVPNVPVAAGSPPRMRGKVPRNLTDYQTRRITPAYAGKRRALLFQARQYGDHPRVCGEKWVILQKYLAGQGSPPRMRGKDQALKYAVKGARITPAYAGKSTGGTAALSDFGDHPRVCGEKCPMCQWRRSLKGSPPRMRGKGVVGPHKPF